MKITVARFCFQSGQATKPEKAKYGFPVNVLLSLSSCAVISEQEYSYK